MSDTQLWKGAIVPASIVAAIALIADTVLKGKSGFLGGLLASITVIIFFSVHLLVARISRDLDPMATMMLAMFSYFAKVIFMGDSGAMFLGLMISASAITLTGQVDASAITAENSGSALLPLLLPFTVLAIPLLDFAMAIIRRLRAGRSPFTADREHLHHRIMRMGLTQQRTTVVLYLWTAMFAIPTAIAAFIPIWIALLVGVVIFALSILVIKRNRNTVIIEHNRSAKVK